MGRREGAEVGNMHQSGLIQVGQLRQGVGQALKREPSINLKLLQAREAADSTWDDGLLRHITQPQDAKTLHGPEAVKKRLREIERLEGRERADVTGKASIACEPSEGWHHEVACPGHRHKIGTAHLQGAQRSDCAHPGGVQKPSAAKMYT